MFLLHVIATARFNNVIAERQKWSEQKISLHDVIDNYTIIICSLHARWQQRDEEEIKI